MYFLNCRKRLGLPEDDIISTKSFAVKQRQFEKVNERLSLKLRASEEMRLQLKLEKNDLKYYLCHHFIFIYYKFFTIQAQNRLASECDQTE